MNRANLKKWLVETPLPAAWRRRLDIFAGIFLTGAAVAGLSHSIKPNAERLAELQGIPPVTTSPLPVEMPGAPLYTAQQANDFITAATAGDIPAMRKAHRVGMPFEHTLSLAAKTGKLDAVIWLLMQGANIHDEERTTDAPILAADAYPDVAKFLQAHGAAEPSLATAARAGAMNAFNRILAAHPEEAKDGDSLVAAAGTTSADVATRTIMVQHLLNAGADPNTMSGGESMLGAAIANCRGSSDNCLSIPQFLVQHGAKVTGDALASALSLEGPLHEDAVNLVLNQPLEKGVTANGLSGLTSDPRPEDIKRVVKEKGVDWAFNDGEDDAAIPLLAAVRQGNLVLVRLLIDAGAPVDVHYKDATCALAEAIDNSRNDANHVRIAEVLIQHGANVNRRFADGRTPLFAAAESGDIRLVNFLLDHHARPNDVILNDTPLDAAEQNGNIPAARVLAAHGAQRGIPPFDRFGRMGM